MQGRGTKRQREQFRLQQRQTKELKRDERKKLKLEPGTPPPEGEDPDIAGIIPGPQPLPQ
jgi:hypothetical protein